MFVSLESREGTLGRTKGLWSECNPQTGPIVQPGGWGEEASVLADGTLLLRDPGTTGSSQGMGERERPGAPAAASRSRTCPMGQQEDSGADYLARRRQ